MKVELSGSDEQEGGGSEESSSSPEIVPATQDIVSDDSEGHESLHNGNVPLQHFLSDISTLVSSLVTFQCTG